METKEISAVFITILLAGLNVSSESRSCEFPGSLQHAYGWFHMYVPDSYGADPGDSQPFRVGLEIRFTPTQMKAIFTKNVRQWPFNSTAFDPYVRTCEEILSKSNASFIDGQTYIVSEETSSGSLGYRCMQLVNRTEFVFQVKLSSSTTDRSEVSGLCGSATLDRWPIVRYQMEHEPPSSDCVADGGYQFVLMNHTLYGEVGPSADEIRAKRCKNLALDLACLPGEGVRVDFRDGFCVPHAVVVESLKSYLQMQCIASWTENYYTFRILSHQSDFYTLRLPIVHDDSFKAILFKGAVIDPTLNLDTANLLSSNFYVVFSIAQKRDYSLCENDQEDCSNAPCLRGLSNSYSNRCLRTCNLCNDTYNALTIPCNFDDYTQGRWINSRNQEQLSINGSIIKIPGYGQFQCVNVLRVQGLEGSVVMATFDNGCRTRFKCLSLKRDGNRLRWRIGNGFEPWPGYGPTLPDHVTVCHASSRLQWSAWNNLIGVNVKPLPSGVVRHAAFLKTTIIILTLIGQLCVFQLRIT